MCNTNEFAHLHLHTDASLIDGLGTVDRTISHAKSLGFDAIGMTDHGSLTNALSFIETAIEKEMKPIIGLEGYVNISGKRHHITLLGDGNKGFANLVNLNNLGVEKYDGRPTFDMGDFKDNNEGVYLLTGCPESPMQVPNYSDAKDSFRYLKKIFENRMFVEMMLVSYGTPYERAMKLSDDFKTPIVVTNDVHFAKKEDKDLHQKLMAMKTGGFTYDSKHLYLATPQQLVDRISIEFGRPDLKDTVVKGMRNAGKLSKMLNTPKFNSNPKLPHIPNSDKKLWKLIEDGYKEKCNSGLIQDSTIYRDRFKREFDVIKGMGFSSYFLILHDIVNYSHKNNIWVGKGRGSGAGCLILYLIGITGVDPIEYGLFFDRFLNYKRSDMPDVDVDFDKEKRDMVIDYASKKWKAESVATYSTYQHKSIMLDLKKQFRIPNDLANEASEMGKESKQMEQLFNTYKGLKDMYEAIEGQYKNLGKHAGGVVINEDGFPLPMIKTTNGGSVVAWTEGTYRELSKVGLVKFDLLGLSSGSVVRRLLNKFGENYVPAPTNNHEVFDIFNNTNTTGIFQFGTNLNKSFLKLINVTSIHDLVAINALCRPGPLGSGASYEYADLKKNGTRRYLHKDIDHFLDETLGVIAYQEQYMQIIAYLIGGDMADGDLARKLFSKPKPNDAKWVKKFNELQKQFFDGAKSKGWSNLDAQKVWDEIKTHGEYSFNKSHSVSYSLLAWELAWFKHYHPVDFFTALLNVEKDNADKVEEYMFDAVLNGIEFQNPDINLSTNEYEAHPEENAIYLPLTAVKYVSDTSYAKLLKERNLKPFSSIMDYSKRVAKSVVKSRGREGFLALGVFDSVGVGSDTEKANELLSCGDVEGLTKQAIQQKYLGFALPTKKFIQSMDEAKHLGMVCGVVTETEIRNKGRGDYQVVKMKPEGVFWHNELGRYNIQEGDTIAVKISDKGRAETIMSVSY